MNKNVCSFCLGDKNRFRFSFAVVKAIQIEVDTFQSCFHLLPSLSITTFLNSCGFLVLLLSERLVVCCLSEPVQIPSRLSLLWGHSRSSLATLCSAVQLQGLFQPWWFYESMNLWPAGLCQSESGAQRLAGTQLKVILLHDRHWVRDLRLCGVWGWIYLREGFCLRWKGISRA